MNSSINWYLVRRTILCLADVIGIALAFFIALLARFDFSISKVPQMYIAPTLRFIPAAVIVLLFVYYILRLYHSIWRYAGLNEVYRIFVAYIILGAAYVVLDCIPALRIPRGVLFIGYFISFFFCSGIRFGYRLVRSLILHRYRKNEKNLKKYL